jgi:SAM-dependent methyltransferase
MNDQAATLYDERFFQTIDQGSLRSAQVVAPVVYRLVPARRVVDVGCGTAAWAKAFRDLGASDVEGWDGATEPPSSFHLPREAYRQVDLVRSPPADCRFDLAVCLEVAEHLPAQSANGLVALLVGLAPVVLFSAAVPGQGGVGHLNEQWPEFWKSAFAAHGYACLDIIRESVWNDPRVEWWYRQNVFLFAGQEGLAQNAALRAEADRPRADDLQLVHSRILDRVKSFRGLMRQLPGAFWTALRRRFR